MVRVPLLVLELDLLTLDPGTPGQLEGSLRQFGSEEFAWSQRRRETRLKLHEKENCHQPQNQIRTWKKQETNLLPRYEVDLGLDLDPFDETSVTPDLAP